MQNTRPWFVMLVPALALWSVSPATTQVFTPTYMAPDTVEGAGLYVTDSGIDGLVVEGVWRRNAAGYGLGLRAGGVDTGEGAALSVGGEIRGPVRFVLHRFAFALTAGAQGVVGSVNRAGAQVGVSSGRSFSAGPVTFTPYVHPRVAVVASPQERSRFDLEDGDDFRIDFRPDVGVNFRIRPGFSLRVAAGVGDEAYWGVGGALGF
jgi:hypothetical protein